MDNEMIEFDIGLGSGGGDDDGVDMDDEEMVDSPAHITTSGGGGAGASSELYLPEGDLLDLEPYEGMEFESEEAAKAFYNSYARRVGFSTRGDEDQSMSNVFWADPKARLNYTYFGDTVTFDTTYRSNSVNHN
ncbi:hypothetical protein CMV_013390 [Castanea mollissima]|uniref:Protein FAR1-RELATED SEQUENCE n=1 Tax=Castanea mollissima TaxID=60419 RepID=A0A8J4R1S0_9ROSI|nr:hypothetical protein CMV_013390 [Castanea mollissima]